MTLAGWLPTTTLAALATLTARYAYRRYCSPLRNAPVAPSDNFLVTYFGLVPPPKDSDTTDKLSAFLIRVGQDPKQSPVSVCWSIMGTPTVLVNTLRGIKDVLVDGQAKRKGQTGTLVQRGNLIRFIQNLVFGGKSINNTVGEVCTRRNACGCGIQTFIQFDIDLLGLALAPSRPAASLPTAAARAQPVALCQQARRPAYADI